MKTLITTVAAAVLATSFAFTADAAGNSKKKDANTAMSSKQAACHQQAVKKYSAVHFLKRRAFEKKCMGQA